MNPTRGAEKPEHVTAADRDSKLEAQWSYLEKGRERSTLAFVSKYRDELIAEFMEWRRARSFDVPLVDGLGIWEQHRFGAFLDRCAHGVLLRPLVDSRVSTESLARHDAAERWVREHPKGKAKMFDYLESVCAAMSWPVDRGVKSFPDLTPEERARVEAARNEPREPGSDDE